MIEDTFVHKILDCFEALKVEDVITYSFKDQHPMYDYVIIASVTNKAHLGAVKDNFALDGRDENEVFSVNGRVDSGWIIFDNGSIFVHVLLADLKSYYELDDLFSKKAIVYH